MNIRLFTVVAALALSACTPKLVEKLPYYKLAVVQGIPFDAERVLALREGMSREQVQMEIGTPLLNPLFRQNRWDYTYEIVHGGKVKESRHLVVHFNSNNTVSRIEGNALDYARQTVQQKQGQPQ
ncbi:MAG: outer membrane protein assembly factor BamE [Alysiella sp.]|uniref:outer membrane protein assembly factor BamE n=1 Tax=Alysiella sp. TaxID=1872483 RepID=UPI0026DB4A72|nr:outer membrane protein assembly factor BamE [Alysiella sp.]MDO4433912.1 outer membrane protein assembly factor BamE [Alysiella sp.]